MIDGDRRRLAFATVLTVVALPALWMSSRSDAAATRAPTAGAVGVETPTVGPADATTTTYTPAPPVFLDGGAPSPEVPPPKVEPEHGSQPPNRSATVRATFRRYADPSANPCTAPAAPSGALITVLNVNNGRSVTCRNNLSVKVPPGIGLLLHIDVLATIADLADAPITVQLTW